LQGVVEASRVPIEPARRPRYFRITEADAEKVIRTFVHETDERHASICGPAHQIAVVRHGAGAQEKSGAAAGPVSCTDLLIEDGVEAVIAVMPPTQPQAVGVRQ